MGFKSNIKIASLIWMMKLCTCCLNWEFLTFKKIMNIKFVSILRGGGVFCYCPKYILKKNLFFQLAQINYFPPSKVPCRRGGGGSPIRTVLVCISANFTCPVQYSRICRTFNFESKLFFVYLWWYNYYIKFKVIKRCLWKSDQVSLRIWMFLNGGGGIDALP